MVVIVDPSLAVIEVGRWDPFGAAVFAVSGLSSRRVLTQAVVAVRRPGSRRSMSVSAAVAPSRSWFDGGPDSRDTPGAVQPGKVHAAVAARTTRFVAPGRGESAAAAEVERVTRCGRRRPPGSGGPRLASRMTSGHGQQAAAGGDGVPACPIRARPERGGHDDGGTVARCDCPSCPGGQTRPGRWPWRASN